MMYPNATHGLERVYQSQVIALVAAVLMIIPVINILAAIALIVSLVLYMIGINEAGKDDENYKTAFTLIIAQLVISVLNSLIGGWAYYRPRRSGLEDQCHLHHRGGGMHSAGADPQCFPAAAGGRCDTGDGHRADRRIHPVYPVPAGCHHGAEIHWRTGSGCICRTGAVNTIWQ